MAASSHNNCPHKVLAKVLEQLFPSTVAGLTEVWVEYCFNNPLSNKLALRYF